LSLNLKVVLELIRIDQIKENVLSNYRTSLIFSRRTLTSTYQDQSLADCGQLPMERGYFAQKIYSAECPAFSCCRSSIIQTLEFPETVSQFGLVFYTRIASTQTMFAKRPALTRFSRSMKTGG
jgi:hypothetical protein